MIQAILFIIYGLVMAFIGGLFAMWGMERVAPDLYEEFKHRLNREEEK